MNMNANMVIPLPRADSGLQHSIVRFNNVRIDSTRTKKDHFYRRQPIAIINPENHCWIIRFAMGTPGIPIRTDAIAIDYDGVIALGVSFKQTVQLEVRVARWYEVLTWYGNHPDLHVQLSTRMGLLGVVLGTLGLIISLN